MVGDIVDESAVDTRGDTVVVLVDTVTSTVSHTVGDIAEDTVGDTAKDTAGNTAEDIDGDTVGTKDTLGRVVLADEVTLSSVKGKMWAQ